jgi:hypothetical protein
VAEAIDVPNSTNTVPEAINPGSVITGYYTDLNFEPHGWVRTASGAFTSFHPPGTSETFPLAINPAGTIGGNYGDAIGVNHGFLRSRDGTIITFDVPGAGTSLNQGTFATATALNPAGMLAGAWVDVNFVQHGFVRAPDGAITTFDAPGAGTNPNQGEGTFPFGINPQGTITGFYRRVWKSSPRARQRTARKEFCSSRDGF